MPSRDPTTGRFTSSSASGANLGTAYAKIVLDSSSLDKDITNAQKKMKAFGAGLSDVGKNILGLTAPLIAFGALAVKSFAESEQVTAQLDAVLKSTGQTAGVTRDMALNLAEGFQRVTQYSDEAVLSGENMLLTFTNIGKDVFPAATQTILDMSTALGQDLQSSAIQLGKALNDPIAGISALSRVGVTFSESQKAAIEQMVKMGDIAGAQKLILAELQREFGGSAVAAGQTFAGQLVILRNQLDGVMETIGGALVPVLQNMLASIMPIVTQIAAWITANPELVAQIGQTVIIAFALGTALTVVGSVITTVTTIVGGLTAAIGFLLSPIGLLIIAIVGIVYAASQLYPGGLAQLFKDATIAAQQLAFLGMYVLATAANAARQVIDGLITTITNALTAFNQLLTIAGMVKDGKISIGQVVNAAVTGNAGGGSGTTVPYTPGSGGVGARVIPKRAYGGDVLQGMKYTVGERGAETFTAPANGTITPNGENAGGGLVVNIGSINANSEAGGRAAARGFKEELELLWAGRGNS